MNAPNRDTLLTEGAIAKFLRYVQIDSPSSADAPGVPSTPDQWNMARQMEAELNALGLQDVKVDEHAIVTATLPGNVANAPVIGLLAHMDTYPGTPGRGVKPQVHSQYDGGEIHLPAGPVLSPATHPGLERCVGHDIITSDGSTLLGADDKCGCAEVMEVICRLLRDPSLPHGEIRVGFTPDEEIGRGVRRFDVAGFGAVAAYTFDGSMLGEVENQTFNGSTLKVTITGRASHTGFGRNNLINALHLAAQLMVAIPVEMRPETTMGYEGFIHPDQIEGNLEEVVMKVNLRDFTTEGMAKKRRILDGLLAGLEERYPGCRTKVEELFYYQNLLNGLEKDPRIMRFALEAVRQTGLEPVIKGFRGGTDGSVLTEMGLPTPNLFTGGMNFHSRTEWASVQWMEKAVEVGVRLVGLWARGA